MEANYRSIWKNTALSLATIDGEKFAANAAAVGLWQLPARPAVLHPAPAPAKDEQVMLLREVLKQVADLQRATSIGENLTLGDWNMEFLNLWKATRYSAVYEELISRHHLFAVEEVDAEGLSALARACGYQYFISTPNRRFQSVGFLIHPRLQVVESIEYAHMTDVFGIKDLRPALHLKVQDLESGFTFNVIVVHLKSMRGGIKATSAVRRQQLGKLMEELIVADQLTLILGDFNCFLDESDDIAPLNAHGFRLLNRWNQSPTHQFGGRLDGIFLKNLPAGVKLSNYKVRNFWRNQWIGNQLSDHGLLNWRLTLAADLRI